MPSTIRKLEDEPIVVDILSADYDVGREFAEGSARLIEVLDSLSSPVTLIMDVSQVRLGLDDVISGANLSIRGATSMFRHPNVSERVVVTTSSLLKLAARGMDNETFRFTAIKVFETLDEAWCTAVRSAPLGNESVERGVKMTHAGVLSCGEGDCWLCLNEGAST